MKVPDIREIAESLLHLGLANEHVMNPDGAPTELGALLIDYFGYRADVLNEYVAPRLMDLERARKIFEETCERCKPPKKLLPMNKQKGEKKRAAYFTGIINTLIMENASGLPADFDPHVLTTVTKGGKPLRTLARRVDGAFPDVVNPIAIWEIKEYYSTTSFGSRIADGVYESLLDGMELEELREHEGVHVAHILMVDARDTWWSSGGRPYLCRIIDMLHMGYVDEVLFGYEVVDRLPALVQEWVMLERLRAGN
ncbi:MAG: hypothetical protein M3041_11160 [Acidobacteriota bacterium]|nr:hypothetical protein [Acidobacteriota bacterium]